MGSNRKTLFLLGIFAVSLFLTPILFQELASANQDYNYFELAKIEDTDEPFCFAVAGDPQFNRYGHSDEVFGWVMADVNNKDFKFLIVNGDLVQSGFDKQYNDYFNAINQSATPVISVIGNHDVRMGGRSRYENTFGVQTYFNFTVGDNQFIVLDTADHELGAEQLNWLETKLQDSSRTVIVTHIPRASLDDADHFTTLIEEYPPALIIYSHNHNYYNVVVGDTEVIITDSAGGGELPESYISVCVAENQITHEQIFAPASIFEV